MSTPDEQPAAGGSHGEPEAPSSSFFEAVARVSIRFRWLVFLACVGVTGLALQQIASRLQIDTTTRGFLGDTHEATQTLDELEDTFGSDSLMQVIIEGDVFSPAFLERLREMHSELEKIDVGATEAHASERAREAAEGANAADAADAAATADDGFGFEDDDGWGEEAGGSSIDEVTSLINVRQTVWRDGGLWVGGLLDTWPQPQALPALRKRVLADDQLVGQVISADGGHTMVIVRAQRMAENDRNRVHAAVDEVVKKYASDDFHVWLGGPASLDANLFKLMMSDFQRQLGIGMLLIVFIVSVLFRHPLGVLGPVLVVVQSALWMLGAMAASGTAMTNVSNILPLFLICVGMGDSVHIQSVYRDARRSGLDNHAAIIQSVGTTGVPVLFTTLTTALGLLSFRSASLGAIGDMGTFGAIGVTVALILSLTLLPAVLTFNTRGLLGVSRDQSHVDVLDTLLYACYRAGLGRARQRGSLVLGVLLTAFCVGGMSLLGVHHDPLQWIPGKYEIKQAFNKIDEELGGASAMTLMVETDAEGGLKSRDLMLGLEKIKAHADAYVDARHGPIVGTTTGVLDVVRESNRALHAGEQAHYAVPDSQRGVVDMFTLFENSGPEQLRRLATVDMKKATMMVRVKWLEAGEYGPLVDYMKAGVDRHIGKDVRVLFTGAVFTTFIVMQTLIEDLLRSFSLAFMVITIVMVLLLRNLKLGMIAMVPNLMPIIATMGFMGFSGIPVDGGNLMLASIAIGIAVDDTIHFLHQFQSHYGAHGKVEQALQHAFSHSGRAMVTTSIILAGGFLVFMVSEMANVKNFGMLISLAISLALFIDLLFLPTLLRTFYRDRAPA